MSLTFDQLLNDTIRILQGYGLAQPRAAFLGAPLDAEGLSVTVGSADGFEQGVAEIENETIFIDSVDYGSGVLTISPDGRGWFGSPVEAHAKNARITMAPTWPRAQVADALNATITGTYPTLYGVGQSTFTFNPAVDTYEVDATAERVLKVTADTIGPSDEQLQIARYSFNASAPTSLFASGRTITLEKGAFPGRSVTVTYAKQPQAITFGDLFTNSGLSESAALAIKYGACSTLTAFMDTSRLPVDTAQADEYDPSRFGPGTAAKVSGTLYQRYLIEVQNERRRLNATHPPTLSFRTR